MSYTIKKFKDKYTLTNTGSDVITYIVKKLYDCTDFLTIYEGTLLPTIDFEIEFNGDGQYQIDIIDGLEETSVLIKYYLELELSMIEDVFSVICHCDCGCSNCVDIDIEKCTALIIARTKLDAYKRLMNPYHTAFFDIVYGQTKCLIEQEVYCCINNEKINGLLFYNEELFSKFIAYDYLAIYFFELFSACLSDEKEYVRNKFKTSQILCCIKQLGINIKELENLIEDSMATITFNSGAYENLPPSQVGDYTLAVTNRSVTVLTMAMFTSLTTPIYVDPEGDPADAVRVNTLPADGVLYLAGVPVTPGQIINKIDIDAGDFTYESPDQDAFDSDTADFSVRDAGSGLFTT